MAIMGLETGAFGGAGVGLLGAAPTDTGQFIESRAHARDNGTYNVNDGYFLGLFWYNQIVSGSPDGNLIVDSATYPVVEGDSPTPAFGGGRVLTSGSQTVEDQIIIASGENVEMFADGAVLQPGTYTIYFDGELESLDAGILDCSSIEVYFAGILIATVTGFSGSDISSPNLTLVDVGAQGYSSGPSEIHKHATLDTIAFLGGAYEAGLSLKFSGLLAHNISDEAWFIVQANS
jgi:hypothetical protein